ncbi:MAG: hypothetical protein KGJ06_08170 [Pseudomonadota bacterium]|nr:hypothetical protein [Pseudomonadota bacterium]
MRRSTVIWMLVIVIAAFSLYRVKYEVQSLKAQVAATTRELETEKEGLHVASAEWAYLNRPQRLEQLAQKYLPAADMTASQIADVQAIPFPAQMQASLDGDRQLTHVSAKLHEGGSGAR